MPLSHWATRSTPQMVEHIRTLVDRSPLPIVATEGRAHVVRYVNPAFCELIGQPSEAIVGSSLRAPLHESTRAQADAVALLDLVYATGSAEFAVDLARVFGNSRAVHLPCAVWPILGDDDRPGGLLVQVSAPTRGVPMRPVDSTTAEELRDANERLLLAGLLAQEQAEVQNVLRGEAEAALTMRDEFISI